MSQLSFPLCPFYLRSPLMGHGYDLTHRFAWSSMSPTANKLLSFSFIIIIKRSHHCQIVQTTTVVVISATYNDLSSFFLFLLLTNWFHLCVCVLSLLTLNKHDGFNQTYYTVSLHSLYYWSTQYTSRPVASTLHPFFNILQVTAWSLAKPRPSSIVKADYIREIMHIGLLAAWLHPFKHHLWTWKLRCSSSLSKCRLWQITRNVVKLSLWSV